MDISHGSVAKHLSICGVMGPLIITLLQIYCRVPVKESVSDAVRQRIVGLLFGPPCILYAAYSSRSFNPSKQCHRDRNGAHFADLELLFVRMHYRYTGA